MIFFGRGKYKGKIEIASGQYMKGNVDKLRGKANEIEAEDSRY